MSRQVALAIALGAVLVAAAGAAGQRMANPAPTWRPLALPPIDLRTLPAARGLSYGPDPVRIVVRSDTHRSPPSASSAAEHLIGRSALQPGPSLPLALRRSLGAFDAFPLLWAEGNAGGLPVVHFDAAGAGWYPPFAVWFVYSECAFAWLAPCAREVVITSQDACTLSPPPASALRLRGGARTAAIGNTIYLWSGRARIEIAASSSDLAEAALKALRPLNGKARALGLRPEFWPPPDISACPP